MCQVATVVKQGAGVAHGFIEPKLIKVIAQIIMGGNVAFGIAQVVVATAVTPTVPTPNGFVGVEPGVEGVAILVSKMHEVI